MEKASKKISLSPDQATARDAILAWWKDKKKPVLTLGGFAGTGKTTTIAETIRALPDRKDVRIAFCCFTGKASSVLRRKLEAADVYPDYCGTIHALIYHPIIVHGEIRGWRKINELPADLVVVDETSMVNQDIWVDLNSFKIPILAVGDHGQLPPIQGRLNLMESPDLRLEKIHRQAENDPIIKLSMIVRETGEIPFGRHGDFVLKKRGGPPLISEVRDMAGVMILCGYNSTRCSINKAVRNRLGITSEEPVVSDRVICLKNNQKIGIYNGMIGHIEKIKRDGAHWYRARIQMDDDEIFTGRILRRQFGARYIIKEIDGLKPKRFKEQFDWGYCITVHKAQGSEAERVVLIEERLPKMEGDEWRRWLYTGVTRAKERLLVIGQ